jgi:ribonuclease VapC
MIIDSSALLAIVFGEEDRAVFAHAMNRASEQRLMLYIPASVLVESAIAAERRGFAKELDIVLDNLRPSVAPLDRPIAELARLAFRRFGRGFHPAALNFGDCMVYATAQYLALPLLYKGNDFRKTNIPSALPLVN